jgi:hypothetical protein
MGMVLANGSLSSRSETVKPSFCGNNGLLRSATSGKIDFSYERLAGFTLGSINEALDAVKQKRC